MRGISCVSCSILVLVFGLLSLRVLSSSYLMMKTKHGDHGTNGFFLGFMDMNDGKEMLSLILMLTLSSYASWKSYGGVPVNESSGSCTMEDDCWIDSDSVCVCVSYGKEGLNGSLCDWCFEKDVSCPSVSVSPLCLAWIRLQMIAR